MQSTDPFGTTPGFDLESRIRARGQVCGIELTSAAVALLANHARAVLRESSELHLTSITDPSEFLERHLGEAFEGAAMMPTDFEGLLVDLGSGNGYPGIPISAARPGLRVVLAEASHRHAGFLRSVIQACNLGSVSVLERQVQRPSDLEGIEPIQVLTTRAMGGWPKIVPRLAACLAPDGQILAWAGDEMEQIAQRVTWRKLELQGRRALPGRERSWVWRFRTQTGLSASRHAD